MMLTCLRGVATVGPTADFFDPSIGAEEAGAAGVFPPVALGRLGGVRPIAESLLLSL